MQDECFSVYSTLRAISRRAKRAINLGCQGRDRKQMGHSFFSLFTCYTTHEYLHSQHSGNYYSIIGIFKSYLEVKRNLVPT